MVDKDLDTSHATAEAAGEQAVRKSGLVQATMAPDPFEEFGEAARAEGLTPTELIRQLATLFPRSPDMQAVFHAAPRRLFHHNRSIALAVTPAEER